MLQRFTANFSSLITNALSSVQFQEEEDNDKEEKKIAPNFDSGTNMDTVSETQALPGEIFISHEPRTEVEMDMSVVNCSTSRNMEIEEEELFNYAWKEVERREEIKKKTDKGNLSGEERENLKRLLKENMKMRQLT